MITTQKSLLGLMVVVPLLEVKKYQPIKVHIGFLTSFVGQEKYKLALFQMK
jgi:hypothetical protein